MFSFVPFATAGDLLLEALESESLAGNVGPYVTGQTFDHPIEGNDFTVPTVDEDVPFFSDRNHEYNGSTDTNTIASLGLVGAEYVMIANDNKQVANYILETELLQTVDAYYFQDKRIV